MTFLRYYYLIRFLSQHHFALNLFSGNHVSQPEYGALKPRKFLSSQKIFNILFKACQYVYYHLHKAVHHAKCNKVYVHFFHYFHINSFHPIFFINGSFANFPALENLYLASVMCLYNLYKAYSSFSKIKNAL